MTQNEDTNSQIILHLENKGRFEGDFRSLQPRKLILWNVVSFFWELTSPSSKKALLKNIDKDERMFHKYSKGYVR